MRKLPVIDALEHTLSLTFRNLGPALRISWAWILVLVGTTALLMSSTGDMSETDPVPDLGSLLLTVLIFVLVMGVATASIGVAWHRYILLDEGGGVTYNLRADWTVWRYAGNVLAIIFGFVLVAFLPLMLLAAISEYFYLLIFPVIILLSPLVYRFMVKLPAIALERTDFTFKDALAATRGSYWQLLGLIVLYTILALILNAIMTAISSVVVLGGVVGGTLAAVAGGIIQWLGMIFGISLLTTMYGFFVEQRSL
ncbi:MAG: hypothetical protein ACR2OM_02515 [Aestuariivirgaceae bacterium]